MSKNYIYPKKKKKQGPTNRNKETFEATKKKTKNTKLDNENYPKENYPKDYNNKNIDTEEIDNNEISLLYKAIDENNFLFQYLNDIQENKVDSDNIYPNDIINDIDVQNIPLNEINAYKNIIEQSKLIRVNKLNYNFIKKEEINDIKKIPELKIIEEEISDIDSEEAEDNIQTTNISKQKNIFKTEPNANSIQNEKEENKNDNIRQKLDFKYIYFEKNYYGKEKLWYPFNVKYGGKKYFIMTKLKDIINPSKNRIIYYCNNHRLNTINKKILFNNNPCNGKLEYLKNEENFYLIHMHNDICDNKNVKIYDNIGDITINAYKFSDYKDC